MACPNPSRPRMPTRMPKLGAAAHSALIPDQPSTVWRIVRVRSHRSAVERLVIVVAVIAAAVVFALVVERRRPAPPTQSRWAVPTQLDRADFEGTEAPWLVAVFSSSTCTTCAGAIAKARVLASADVA